MNYETARRFSFQMFCGMVKIIHNNSLKYCTVFISKIAYNLTPMDTKIRDSTQKNNRELFGVCINLEVLITQNRLIERHNKASECHLTQMVIPSLHQLLINCPYVPDNNNTGNTGMFQRHLTYNAKLSGIPS